MKKSVKTAIIVISALVVAGIIALPFILNIKGALRVTVQDISRATVEEKIYATGTVKSDKSKSYYVPTAATVSRVMVKTGDRVTSGQLLAQFETSSAETHLSQLKSQIDTADEALTSAQNTQKAVDNALSDINAQIDEYTAKLNEMGADFPSNSTTNESPAKITENTDIDSLLEEYRKATEEMASEIAGQLKNTITQMQYQQMLELLILQKSVLESQKITSAAIDQFASAVELAEETYSQAKEEYDIVLNGIYAEFDGVVTSLNISEGSLATLTSPCLTVADTQSLYVQVSLGKYDYMKAAQGQRALVSLPVGNYEATVSDISSYVGSSSYISGGLDLSALLGLGSGTSGTSGSGVSAQIKITSPDENILLGLEAEVEISVNTAENVLYIPVEAVKQELSGKYCYVFKEGVLHKTAIETGAASDDGYEVVSGLNMGDKVVINPPAEAADGKKAKVS